MSRETDMDGQAKTRAVRYDDDACRIQRGDEIVAMALRLSNSRWGLYDTQERKITGRTFGSAAAVAKAFDAIKERAEA